MSELRQRAVGRCAASASAAQPAADDGAARPARRGRCAGCARCCLRFVALVVALLALGLVGSAISDGRDLTPDGLLQPVRRLNFVFMRLARDLSRAKARRRRFGQRHALMPVLMGTEEPLPLGDADAGIALTLEELAEYDGRELPGTGGHAPLYLAVLGRIYDVSGGSAFYGPGKSYHKLVAKDASRAFCTGCLQPECLVSSLRGLSEEQRREADRWVELYEHHDKYKLVGRVRVPQGEDAPSPEAAERLEAEEVELAEEAEGRKKYKPFRKR